MIRFNDYLDRLSIIKVLSFFLLVILVLTWIPMISDIYLGSLFFKFVLYAVMLLFFAAEEAAPEFSPTALMSSPRLVL